MGLRGKNKPISIQVENQALRSKVDENTAQLAEKPSYEEARLKNEKLTMEDMSDTVISAISGGTTVNVLSIPQDGSVTPTKTTFFKQSKNLFNPNDPNFLPNKGIQGTTSNITDNTSYNVTGFMDGKEGERIFISSRGAEVTNVAYYKIISYKSDNTFISTQAYATGGIVLPASTATFRVQVDKNATSLQIEKGSVSSYEPYRMYIPKDLLEEPDFNINKVPDKSITMRKTDFARIGKNLFDKDAAVYGYVNQTNGNIDPSPNFMVSDFIRIEPNTQYTRSYDNRTAFYTEDKGFISGHYDSSGNTKTLTSPSNAAWMRCTLIPSRLLEFQVEKGAESTDFEPFGYEFIKSKSTYFKPEITLPPKIYGVVGKEINIYFDNVINDRIEKYEVDITCTVGTQQVERWTLIPTSAGTYTLTMRLLRENLVVAIGNTEVIIKEETVGVGVNKKCIFIGDSTTNAGIYPQELINLFDADPMDITLLGTRGTAPALHEGRSGWTTNIYLNDAINTGVTNAFYNNGFDFSYYMTQQGYSSVDYVCIHLGINDIFLADTDNDINTTIPTILANFQTMIDSVKAFNSNIKIGLMITIPPASSQDAFGASYKSGKTRNRHKRNQYLFTKAFISQFKDKEGQGIFLIPTNVNIDTVNNFPVETVAVNSRNSTQVVRQSNGVHPDVSGYYQMADSLYYFFKSFES